MNCLEPPPEIFRILSHFIHIFSTPAYCIALLSLFLIKSKFFTTYRIFLIWHVIENLCFELYSAFLVQPAVHPPYPLIRTTGLLSQWGVSSLIQIYVITTSIEFNGISINEMFYFRYKACLLNYKDHAFTHFLRVNIYLARMLTVFDIVFAVLTIDDAVEFQQTLRNSFFQSSPNATYLKCSTVFILPAFSNYISTFLTVIWLVQTTIPIFIVPGVAVYVNKNVEKSVSAATWKVQQQLLRSLSIQALIHGVMLGIPNFMVLYALFFGYQEESFGYFAILSLMYHGFVSTLAMIFFTRPLRGCIAERLRLRKKVSMKVSMTTSNTI